MRPILLRRIFTPVIQLQPQLHLPQLALCWLNGALSRLRWMKSLSTATSLPSGELLNVTLK